MTCIAVQEIAQHLYNVSAQFSDNEKILEITLQCIFKHIQKFCCFIIRIADNRNIILTTSVLDTSAESEHITF